VPGPPSCFCGSKQHRVFDLLQQTDCCARPTPATTDNENGLHISYNFLASFLFSAPQSAPRQLINLRIGVSGISAASLPENYRGNSCQSSTVTFFSHNQCVTLN